MKGKNILYWIRSVMVIAVKDIKVYYMTPSMIMFGFLIPFFLFFSFTVGRHLSIQSSIVRLISMTIFFTSSSAGQVILPMERRMKTLDRILATPVPLSALIIGKSFVGLFFGFTVSILPVIFALLFFKLTVSGIGLLLIGMFLSSWVFSMMGVFFSSFPVQKTGSVMMPSTLLRWPLLFISGIFIPLTAMSPLLRGVSYISPLTYTVDILNLSVTGSSIQSLFLNFGVLVILDVIFYFFAVKLFIRGKVLGY
ncbi:MAG: ABC transporter permease [Spirochaetales bacterium]|nr:ABC transporter permease [Spirochaetales bacterium]